MALEHDLKYIIQFAAPPPQLKKVHKNIKGEEGRGEGGRGGGGGGGGWRRRGRGGGRGGGTRVSF